MPEKKASAKKSESKPASQTPASKSSHDALVKRVGVAEAQIQGLAMRLNIDLSEFDS